MRNCVNDKKTADNITCHRSCFEVQTRDKSDDESEEQYVRDEKHGGTRSLGHCLQARKEAPFMIRHRVEFMSEEQGNAQIKSKILHAASLCRDRPNRIGTEKYNANRRTRGCRAGVIPL